jgi:hypothetical protein
MLLVAFVVVVYSRSGMVIGASCGCGGCAQ